MKVWMQEWCNYVSKYRIEPGTSGTESHIYNWGCNGGATCWPAAFVFPSALEKHGFSQAQLN